MTNRKVDVSEMMLRVYKAEVDRLGEENDGLRKEVQRLRRELDAANREVAFGAWGGTCGESDEREGWQR